MTSASASTPERGPPGRPSVFVPNRIEVTLIEAFEEKLDQWTDEHRKGNRPDSDGASQKPSNQENRSLDAKTGKSYGDASLCQSGH